MSDKPTEDHSLPAVWASTWAIEQIRLFTQGMCRNSLGPWALERGPSTPVTTNCALGQISLRKVRKGMDPPSEMARGVLPKYYWLAFSSTSLSTGGYSGALKPCPLLALVTFTCASQGGLSVSVLTMNFRASSAFLVGGSLTDIFASVKGSMTLPAVTGLGRPSMPVTASWGFHPFRIKDSSVSWLTFCRLPTVSKDFTLASPTYLARSLNSLYLLAGISTSRALAIRPVSWFSSLSRRLLKILKEEGTIPDADPLCTPSLSTSILIFATAYPLREVVTQSLSQSTAPESRQKTSFGCPILSLRSSMCFSTSPLEVSSSPSKISTHPMLAMVSTWDRDSLGLQGLDGEDGPV